MANLFILELLVALGVDIVPGGLPGQAQAAVLAPAQPGGGAGAGNSEMEFRGAKGGNVQVKR